MSKKMTEEQIQQIIDLAQKGTNYKEICKITGYADGTIYRLLKKKGVKLISCKYEMGTKFNKLTLEKFHSHNGKERLWLFRCECGNEKVCQLGRVVVGINQSCGCSKEFPGNNWRGIGELGLDFYNHIKYHALSKNRKFKISHEFLWNLFLKQNRRCIYSGLELTLTKKNRTASLDRIDSKKGYLEDNVQWVHKTINLMKHKLSHEDFIKICGLIWENNKNQVNNEYNTEALTSYSKIR